MKNKTKKILATACLGLVGMGCLTGCNEIPNDFDHNVTTTITGEKQYRLTVINDSDHGTIYPDLKGDTSSVMVEEGDSYTFTIRAKEGYKLDNLIIDGELCEPQEIYTFEEINSDHSIGAIYSSLIDIKKQIQHLSLVAISFDLCSAQETSENVVEDFDISFQHREGTSSWTSYVKGECCVGKNQSSPYNNYWVCQKSRVFEDIQEFKEYNIHIGVGNYDTDFKIKTTELDLEYYASTVVPNAYIMKMDENFILNNQYKLTNLVFYFSATYYSFT